MDDITIVVTGDAPLSRAAVAAIPPAAIVIAADGALDHALAAGIQPAALVGDLDSVSDEGLEWAQLHATIDRHPPDKDSTDTELAVRRAVDLAPASLTLLAGGGDRLDHMIAAIGSLGHPALTSVPHLDGWWGDRRFHVIHGPGQLRLEQPVGTTVSLLALHGSCGDVSISGVRWPLLDTELEPLVGLGVSNETTVPDVDVTVTSGVLTVFVNERLDDDHAPDRDRPGHGSGVAPDDQSDDPATEAA